MSGVRLLGPRCFSVRNDYHSLCGTHPDRQLARAPPAEAFLSEPWGDPTPVAIVDHIHSRRQSLDAQIRARKEEQAQKDKEVKRAAEEKKRLRAAKKAEEEARAENDNQRESQAEEEDLFAAGTRHRKRHTRRSSGAVARESTSASTKVSSPSKRATNTRTPRGSTTTAARPQQRRQSSATSSSHEEEYADDIGCNGDFVASTRDTGSRNDIDTTRSNTGSNRNIPEQRANGHLRNPVCEGSTSKNSYPRYYEQHASSSGDQRLPALQQQASSCLLSREDDRERAFRETQGTFDQECRRRDCTYSQHESVEQSNAQQYGNGVCVDRTVENHRYYSQRYNSRERRSREHHYRHASRSRERYYHDASSRSRESHHRH